MDFKETAHNKVWVHELLENPTEEGRSPFLKPAARLWGLNLPLKTALLGALFLLLSVGFSLHESYASFSALFLALTFFLVGTPAAIDALENLRIGNIDIDLLMTLGAFSALYIGSGHEGALLLVLFALAGAMEFAVTQKAKLSLRKLYKLSSQKAWLIKDTQLALRSVKDIPVGARIMVKAGELVPLDGDVVAGQSSVSLAHLTGESIPHTKAVGDKVTAGSLNLDGSLEVLVTRLNADSTLSRIIHLVTEAEGAKLKAQSFLDSISNGYSQAIIAISISLVFALHTVWGMPFAGENGSIYRAVAFLIAASPCALILAIPVTTLSAISASVSQGMIPKGGASLEVLAKCKTFVFDKTGTLTTGKLKVCDFVIAFGNQEKGDLLTAATALERSAQHPLAQAIVAYAAGSKAGVIHNFKVLPGSGVEADGLFLGSLKAACDRLSSEKASQLQAIVAGKSQHKGAVSVLLSQDTAAVFFFEDELRPHIEETMLAMKALGARLVLLSGDRKESVDSVAKSLHFDEALSELKPDGKLESVSGYKKAGLVAMVGDGLNDAPAMALADCGLAMAEVGSATTAQKADIVFLKDELSLLPGLVRRARLMQRVIAQNLIFAFSIMFGASLLTLFGFIPLWLAVCLHEGGTVLVGLNGLRCLRSGQQRL